MRFPYKASVLKLFIQAAHVVEAHFRYVTNHSQRIFERVDLAAAYVEPAYRHLAHPVIQLAGQEKYFHIKACHHRVLHLRAVLTVKLDFLEKSLGGLAGKSFEAALGVLKAAECHCFDQQIKD